MPSSRRLLKRGRLSAVGVSAQADRVGKTIVSSGEWAPGVCRCGSLSGVDLPQASPGC